MSDERWVGDVRALVITRVQEELSVQRLLTDDQVPHVLVLTPWALPAKAQNDVRNGVREVRATFGNGDGRVRVEFDTAVDAPHPCAVRWGLPEAETAEAEPEESHGSARLLVLGFAGVEFHFLLEPAADWLPLVRPAAGYDGVGLLLPQSLAGIPHGHLVDLCYRDGVLSARRAAERLDYVVSVDGVDLVADGAPVPASGEIRYVSRVGGEARALTYELVDWSDEVPGPGGGADVLDGAPHPAEYADPGHPGTLLVQPPEPGTKAGGRRFPLPTGRDDVRVRDVHVQVLHTTATHPGSAERSHVKIYRCATPQHAAYLRRHLATQAGLVRQANAVAGRAGERAWAVAPIHLVAATPPPEVLTTRAVPMTVAGGPEHRLSAWFGVPGQPQPDCFVLVASPLLDVVGWAGYEQLGKAPSGVQLAALTALAAGVDKLHDLGVAHCDIKPQNVCHHLDAQGRSTYVLIDGDAITRSVGPVGELRFTPEYASTELIRAARQIRAPGARDTIDLTEHDRFGFVLVVLTALIGVDKVDALVRGEEGKRPVDSVSLVSDTLRDAWSPEWAKFTAQLTSAFQPGALLESSWTATAWLERLTALWSPERVEPPAEAARIAAGRFGREVTAIRTDVRDERAPAWAEWRDELIDRLRAAQQQVARDAYGKWLWLGRIAFGVSLLLLVLTLAGGLK
ncbi:hypothetical protein [Lentzea sp. NEAU-D7]|uniref:hypothetical protein n=1 Tax=Lentzea sp. NEAU-D7 TaxID=2994667 RepID=UPI00224A6715|nr:hypothetical protein [Lentzea sp. NEAU-D7]MCX2949697.1 hypothetical protein [Lentzea sp. NEAU-D7]